MKEADKAGAGTRSEALRLMWWLVVPVLALLVVLTVQQYRQGLTDAERGLLRRAEERAQELEAIARPAEAHIHDLKRLLENNWHTPPSSGNRLREMMRPVMHAQGAASAPDGWTLDQIPGDSRSAVGQIWWAPADRSTPDAAWLDRAALFLRTARVAHERSPGFQGSYFVAGEANISWAYPWVDTPTMLVAMGVPDLQGLEQLRLAGAERGKRYVANNPEDLTYWGPPYVGQLDGDLVQSHGSIVMVDGQYAGEVSVDFRIQSLQLLANRWQDLEGARVWVMDRSGNIVADSRDPLIIPKSRGLANQSIEIKVSSRLPLTSAQALSQILPASASGKLVRVGNDVLLAAARTQSPWVYVFAVPQSTLRAEVLPSLVPNALLGLALLLVFVAGQWLFARWFVTPALGVLQYLRSLSADPSTPQPSLGKRWHGWIRAIHQVFEHQRMAQQQLEAQREALRQSEKLSAMGTLLAGVAHELNNPLAIVMGRASLLDERVQMAVQNPDRLAWSPIQEDSRRIRQAADRCGRIVRTFLNMARQRPATRGPVRLNDVVRSSLDMVGYTLRSRSIEVELHLADDLPSVEADADQIGQVLLNLIVNAQQAVEPQPNQRRITISTGFVVQPLNNWGLLDAPQVWLEVGDSGPGVPADVRDRLFEPFFTTKAPGLGTGLGLSVSRNVAREHGGDLVLLPADAGGAHFRLMLPVTPPAAPAEPRAPVPDVREATTVQRILVVDDEQDLVEVIRSTLENAGYEVSSAESGEVALELIAEARFDAIVSDMRMPDIDGRTLWKGVQSRSPALARRMLFVTGDTLSADARALLAETACTGLDKPFEQVELLTAVRTLVRR